MAVTKREFLKMVDWQLAKLSEGVITSRYEIADYSYLDFWDEDMSPAEAEQGAREAAYEALDDEGFPFADDVGIEDNSDL